jgi:hypothetical protein
MPSSRSKPPGRRQVGSGCPDQPLDRRQWTGRPAVAPPGSSPATGGWCLNLHWASMVRSKSDLLSNSTGNLFRRSEFSGVRLAGYDTSIPATLRRNLTNAVTADRENCKDAVVLQRKRCMPIGIIASKRDQGLHAELAIPQASMMGANVPDYIHGKQPGIEHLLRHPENGRDILLDSV